jgi:rhamnogalacturonyl hydrolase YesR
MMDCCGTMGIALLESVLRHGERKPTPEQRQLVGAIADYISHRQPRSPEGIFWRPEWSDTVWADDLYKGCAFLSRWYEFTGEAKFLDEAARQIIGMSKWLQADDGLWYHGYFHDERRTNGAKWGRANGWAMVANVEVLSAMPENHPSRAALLAILRRQVEGVEKVQSADGMWRQLLDHPEFWEETSCTAMFAYSIARAVNRGWIDAGHFAFARKAFAAVSRHVTPDGAVTDVCEGTGIFGNVDYYARRKRPHDELHGRGPVMLAGAEILQHDNPPQTRP